VAQGFAARHPVSVIETRDSLVLADQESLEQVLIHLVQNAVDASTNGTQILLNIYSDGINGMIEVVDSGHGMAAEFVRTRLFKPFVSSKPGGFGIGAYEARELVRAMKGRLEVESHEGLGSRFTIRLPLAAATGLLDQKVA
jgi:signal transduction histidine kinase